VDLAYLAGAIGASDAAQTWGLPMINEGSDPSGLGGTSSSNQPLVSKVAGSLDQRLRERAQGQPWKLIGTAAMVGFVLGYVMPVRVQLFAMGAAAKLVGRTAARQIPPGFITQRLGKVAVPRASS
jgi:hypothetical protein